VRQRRVPSIGAVQPVHVATWIEAGTRGVRQAGEPGDNVSPTT
jgi:hypothetical protein